MPLVRMGERVVLCTLRTSCTYFRIIVLRYDNAGRGGNYEGNQ